MSLQIIKPTSDQVECFQILKSIQDQQETNIIHILIQNVGQNTNHDCILEFDLSMVVLVKTIITVT